MNWLYSKVLCCFCGGIYFLGTYSVPAHIFEKVIFQELFVKSSEPLSVNLWFYFVDLINDCSARIKKPPRKLTGAGLRLRDLCQSGFNHFSKSLGIVHSDISQHLAIDNDLISAHPGDETAVSRSVQAGSSINTGDPKTAQVAFAIAAVIIGIPLSMQESLISSLE